MKNGDRGKHKDTSKRSCIADRICNESVIESKTYETLGFPYNQTTLLDYAVIEEGGKQEKPTSNSLKSHRGL